MCRPSNRVLPAAALAAALALTATVGFAQAPPPPAAAPAPPAKAAPTAPVAPAAPIAPGAEAAPGVGQPAAAGGVLVPTSEFRYNPTGRRDPFKSLLQLEKKQRDVAALPPIQQFDLETVKVVGIVVDPARGAQAMIRAPNGQTFVVRKGTIIGKNEGEVVEITMKGILVVEKFLDFMNRETRKETFLKSHPTAGK